MKRCQRWSRNVLETDLGLSYVRWPPPGFHRSSSFPLANLAEITNQPSSFCGNLTQLSKHGLQLQLNGWKDTVRKSTNFGQFVITFPTTAWVLELGSPSSLLQYSTTPCTASSQAPQSLQHPFCDPDAVGEPVQQTCYSRINIVANQVSCMLQRNFRTYTHQNQYGINSNIKKWIHKCNCFFGFVQKRNHRNQQRYFS